MDERPFAVVNVSPVYRRGLIDLAQEIGLRPVEPRSVASWLATTPHGVAAVAVRAHDDMMALREMVAVRTDAVVVALIGEASPCWYAEALAAGADAVVTIDAPAQAIKDALEAASRRVVVLPRDVARFIASHAPHADVSLDDDRVMWLRRLAAGVTIDQLAQEIGYSRRATYRLLRDVYRDIGAGNRTSALVAAARSGLL